MTTAAADNSNGFISWLTVGQPGNFGWEVEKYGYSQLASVGESHASVFEALGLRARVCSHNPGGIYAARMVFDQFARREAVKPGAISDYIKSWQPFIDAGGELIDYVGFCDPNGQQTPSKYLESSGVLPMLEANHSIAIDSGAVKLPEDFDTAVIQMMGGYIKPGARIYVEGVPETWGAKKLWQSTPVMWEEDNGAWPSYFQSQSHQAEQIVILKGDGPNAADDHKLNMARELVRTGKLTPAAPLYHWIGRGVDVVARWTR